MTSVTYSNDLNGRSDQRATHRTNNRTDRSADFGADFGADYREPHLAIQILSIFAFGIFSIVAVSLAFSAFWVAGFITTLVITWTWAGSRMFGGRQSKQHRHFRGKVRDLAPSVLEPRSSGNANFDAYRSQMLESLEAESREFEGFLTRLRDAHGKMEFDKYMDDRAVAAKEARGTVIYDEDVEENAPFKA